jgi:hypothetical protein
MELFVKMIALSEHMVIKIKENACLVKHHVKVVEIQLIIAILVILKVKIHFI